MLGGQVKTDEELQAWCYDNWLKLPEDVRKKCVDHLDEAIPADYIQECIRVGGYWNMDYFHFGAGMSIRNLLRNVVTDAELPYIPYENGESYQNWDDFYTGAMDDLLERYK